MVSLALAVALVAAAPFTFAGQEPSAKFELKSPAFREGGTIPKQFTCSGANRSPFLFWNHTRRPHPELCIDCG